MLTFLADPRDGVQSSGYGVSACQVCCCKPATVRPGETNPWAINYASWVAPIGGRGLVGTPVIEIENITPTVATSPSSNRAPTNTDYDLAVVYNTALTDTVATNAADLDADPLTYARLPLYGPSNGTLTMAANGAFTYTPTSGFSGYDEFYFTTKDGINPAVVNRVGLRVNPALPAPALAVKPAQAALHIPLDKVSIRSSAIFFPVVASPSLKVNDVWRLTFRQAAMDCDGTAYYNTMCIEASVGKC